MKFEVLYSFLVIIALGMAVEVTVEETETKLWENYKATYSKSYPTKEEDSKRKKTFLQNLDFVLDHNKKFEKGDETFDVAINSFADMTNQEFVQQMLTFHQPEAYEGAGVTRLFQGPETIEDLPSSVDWRNEGAVTPIKDQGACGSCWAFSTTGSLEGQHFLSTGELVSLSEQNLVDCALPSTRRGCDGGWMVTAFDYIINSTGVDTEASYPYESQDGMEGSCRFNASNVGATMTGYVNITEGSESDLQAAVASVGPISVAIDAGHLSFQLYHSGVYKKWLCQKKHLNHAVLVVGYGTKSGRWLWDGDYWLVKNSWGTSWGMDGYILMARNHNNMCGIATLASYPLV